MTIWQKISGIATSISSGGLLGHLSGVFGGERERDDAPEHDIAFTIGVIALGAKMAKADGVVSSIEVDTFKHVFQVAPEEERNVERVFNLAKQDVAGYEAYADQIARLLRNDRALLQHVLEGLLHIAAADGAIHPGEDRYLKAVAQRFAFSDSEFRYIRSRFVHDGTSPYEVLRIAPSASNDEIKAQYRRLVKDNHPDRIMARGVPKEFVEVATRKLAAINAAYEKIARERGL